MITPAGASYFGFYATGGHAIAKVTITDATAGEGIAVGEFGIAALPPAVITGPASDITSTGAELGGTVNPDFTSTSSYFEYGTSASYGQSAPSPSAHDGNGSEAVTANAAVAGLQPGTTYHYRLVAVNIYGETVDGADQTFATTAPAPITPAAVVTPAPAVKHCLVPKLSHLSLGAAKSALAKAGCQIGNIKRQKRPTSTKGLSYGVLSEAPAAGMTVALASKVKVTVGWFKPPTPKKHTGH